MGRGGEGRGEEGEVGRDGRGGGRGGGRCVGVQRERSRWKAVLEKWGDPKWVRSPVGRGPPLGGPGEEQSLVRANMSRFFLCRLPTLILYVSNLLWFFSLSCVGVLGVFMSEDPKAVGLSYDVRCVFCCQ